MEVTDNKDMRHFEATINDELAIIEYQIQEKKYFLTKAIFPEAASQEQHFEMIESALNMIEETGMRVVPMTKPIKEFFKKNRDRRNLLPVGIHL